jgi:hypothetical protein
MFGDHAQLWRRIQASLVQHIGAQQNGFCAEWNLRGFGSRRPRGSAVAVFCQQVQTDLGDGFRYIDDRSTHGRKVSGHLGS